MSQKRKYLAERQGPIKRLHVDQGRMRLGLPAVTVQTSSGSLKARDVEIDGPSVLIHSEVPLSCGAKIWIETKASLKGKWV